MTIPSQVPMRKCSKCGKLKPLDAFLPVGTSQTKNNPEIAGKWIQNRCRDCYNEYCAEWRAKQGDKYRTQQLERYNKRIAELSLPELEEYRTVKATAKRNRHALLKEEVYSAYGGYKCACCGETEPSFLTLDHVNSDGHQMRTIHGTDGTAVLRWAKANGYPDTLQIFCWNCQWGKRKNNGICPHQERCND